MGVKVDYQNQLTNQDLDTIYLTGAGYYQYPFKGVSRDSKWGWREPVWGGDLTRSQGDFVLTNIETVSFGLVARCEISFKYMNVQDYRALCEIAKQRVCTADYYDREKGERVSQEMAFTGNDLKQLYAFGQDYIGNLDVSIKLVATNRDKQGTIDNEYTVSYNANGGTGSIASRTATWGDSVTLAKSGFTRAGKVLKLWATKDINGNFNGYYDLGQHVTVYKNLNLFAIWE